MADIMLFRNAEEIARNRVHLGFNNLFDSTLAGVARTELVLIGGRRGAGKSITCSNILVNQYESGNTSVYFTIEMEAHETLERNLAILAEVPHSNIRKGTLNDDELLRVVKARAGMFIDSEDLVEEFKRTRNKYTFEQKLVRDKQLKPNNQMIIVDDRALTITNLDLHIGKIKARFGDKFTVAVVDYLNQITVEGASQFDWQPQIIIAKKLKDLARKYDIVVVSPYQIDATGEARFAKGILDSADIALVMEAHDKEKGAMSFTTTKIRGSGEIACTSAIDWDSLRIFPTPISLEDEPKEGKKTKKVKKESTSNELPWDV